MLRKLMPRPRTTRMLNLICLVSVTLNIYFITKPYTIIKTNLQRQQLGSFRLDGSLHEQMGFAVSINRSEDYTFYDENIRQVTISSDNTVSAVREDVSGNTGCILCPYHPPSLVGPLADMTKDMTPEELMLIFPEMTNGRLHPSGCTAREKVAIIIPYRNRYPHLHVFLHNIIPFLIRQQADATIFVIEQALPEKFNRGALLNVGFLEAEKIDMYDCFIFHDVDLIPLDDRHMYRCGDNPKHFAVAMNKYNFRLPYTEYFGGAVGFSRKQYLDINGCSNVYFGWGGEDDEMIQRVLKMGYIISRAPVKIARYDMIKHSRDKGNEDNPVRKTILLSARNRQAIDGLNTIKYTTNSVTFHKLYVWLNVSLNQTEILQNSPDYILKTVMAIPKNITNAVNSSVSTLEARKKTHASRKGTEKSVSRTNAVKSNAEADKVKSISGRDAVKSVAEIDTVNVGSVSQTRLYIPRTNLQS